MDTRSSSTSFLNFLSFLPLVFWYLVLGWNTEDRLENGGLENKLVAEVGPVFRPPDSQAKLFSSPLQLCYIDRWCQEPLKEKKEGIRKKEAGHSVSCHKMRKMGIHQWMSTKIMKYLFSDLVALLGELMKLMFLGFIKIRLII